MLRSVVLVLCALAAGCTDQPAPSSDGPARELEMELDSEFSLNNKCFALRAGKDYVKRSGTGFTTAGSDFASAERFYMKPAGLGRFIFYTADRMFMTGSGAAVSAATAPSNGADWTVAMPGDGVFTAAIGAKSLAANESGALILADAAAPLTFESATGCTDYPEMPVGIGETFKGPPAGEEVLGFAEVHAHMAMGSDMSDGSGTRGPSAGGVMYGHAANRFGVIEALKNCSGPHGPDGELSPEWLILDAGGSPPQHDTQGWPSFIDWPKSDSQLHQQMYYKWVERAYRAGLRTMVIHGTNIEALCNVAKQTGGNKDPKLLDEDCTDMGVGVKQVEYLYDIEKYVDAQEGGPGKGWFQIVKDPAEAREVIAEGKMAVIPGLEFSNIFSCNVTYTPADAAKTANAAGTSACTKEQIDSEIERVWDLGVRAVFPYHDVDSALGGTGIFGAHAVALNAVNFAGTRGFLRTYDCEDGGEGDKFFYDAGAKMYSGSFPAGFGNDPITQALKAATGGILPLYKTGVRQCNARDVTDLGKYALDKIMKKGFTLDIDHAEIRAKQIMLDMGKALTPNYPMISGHGGHGGINNAQAQQMIEQGGIIYPSAKNGAEFKAFLDKLKPIWTASGTQRPLAIGYGADANGLANLPKPRGAAAEKQIQYPFTLFQGPGWGSQFAAAGIAPLQVEMLAIPGGQSWNMDEVGMAHYGMIADIVEEIRIEGGEEATTALYRSAETYLKLWEQTLAASANARTKPSP